MLKIGIAGLGAISSTHLAAIGRIPELAVITAVCDCDIEKKDKVPGAKFYLSLKEMLEKESLDCLHICLPHYLHVPAARMAAEYGVSVFMEKPAGIHMEDIRHLEEDPNISGIQLGICLQNRYNPTTVKALEVIRQKTYGDLKGCKVTVTWDRTKDYYSRDPWRGQLEKAGGGVMLSQAIHSMDLMCLFCGEVEWVKGMSGNLLLEDIEVEDTACAHIAFKNGRSGIFYGSVTHCCNSSIEIELVFDEAELYIKNNRLVCLQAHRETVLAEDEILPGGKDYYGFSHYNAILAFYRSLLGQEGGSFISLEEAKAVHELIENISLSAKENRKVYQSAEPM